MAEAWLTPGHRAAEGFVLVGQAVRQALGEARNLHCKPQCHGLASDSVTPRQGEGRLRRSAVATRFGVDGSVP
jgi:hypothetical protein